jgi:acetylornithine deacetylase/succinyl-diaminopimelate desuccinylase-like protein
MINPLPFALIPVIVLMSVNSIADDIIRPRYELDLSQPYSTDGVTAYAEDHSEIYAHVDANIGQHTANLQRWLRQPSISAQNVGIREMAAMVRDDLKAIGFQEANLVETKGHPGVWGYYDAGAPKTLMVYLMYDVQPVNPEDWQSPPFAADIVDVPVGKAIMARGAANQKGPERAFLNALESIIAVKGSLPVNIMVTAEGEEELGSPNYAQIVDQYEDRLRTADGVIFPTPGQNENGHTNVVLGVKGIVYWELEARGGSWGGPAKAEIHGSFKAITDSPVLRLIQAISTLVSDDGNTILVLGYDDDVCPPAAEEQSLIAGYLAAGGINSSEAPSRIPDILMLVGSLILR